MVVWATLLVATMPIAYTTAIWENYMQPSLLLQTSQWKHVAFLWLLKILL